jgi:hypothetical protein
MHPIRWISAGHIKAMGTAAAVIQTFQTDEWNANMYGALSLVSNIAVSVQNRANTIQLAYTLHKSNRKLQAIFSKIHAAAEGKIKPSAAGESVTQERAQEISRDMIRMYQSIDRAYESMRAAGFLNNSLTSAQVQRFKHFGEEILDLADWIETSLHSEEVNALFERGSAERERGEMHNLDQVK